MNIKNFFSKTLRGERENPTSSTSLNLEGDEYSTADEVVSEIEDSDSDQIKSPRKRKYSHQKPGGGNSKFQQQYITKYEKDHIKASSKGNSQFF